VSRRRAVLGALAAAAAVAGVRAWYRSDDADGPDTSRDVSLTPGVLYSTRYPALDGRPTSLAEWQGRILVLNFWATWCPPCREEIPSFMRIARAFAAKGVQFVGIAIDERERVVEFVRATRLDYPILLAESDGMALAARAGNVRQALPYTALVDRAGQIVRTRLGVYPADALQRALGELSSG
jgi:thiol-disulfide isomerase/thioredoxin